MGRYVLVRGSDPSDSVEVKYFPIPLVGNHTTTSSRTVFQRLLVSRSNPESTSHPSHRHLTSAWRESFAEVQSARPGPILFPSSPVPTWRGPIRLGRLDRWMGGTWMCQRGYANRATPSRGRGPMHGASCSHRQGEGKSGNAERWSNAAHWKTSPGHDLTSRDKPL